MEVWADDILSDENSDYEIVVSDSDVSMPSLEEADNVITEEEFVENIIDNSGNIMTPSFSPTAVWDTDLHITIPAIPSMNNNSTSEVEDGEIAEDDENEDFSDEPNRLFGEVSIGSYLRNLRDTSSNTLPMNYNISSFYDFSNQIIRRPVDVPRLHLRNVRRNLLIDIDVQDCLDMVIRSIEIEYETPFAIKCQKMIRGYLAKKKMVYLKKVAEESKKPKSCSVCYNELNVLNMSVTPCGHYYCSSCLFRWMNEKNTCAMCRQELYVPKIDMTTLRRDTRRAVRYHSNLQRRILDMEMNKMKIEDETRKIVKKANLSLARQVRMRCMLAETRQQIENEHAELDEIYDEYLDLIYDCKTEFNVKIKLEKHLSNKFKNHFEKHITYKNSKKNKKRIAEKIVQREDKNKVRKVNYSDRHADYRLNFTIEQLQDNTDYESFVNFWEHVSEQSSHDDSDYYELVDEIII